MSNAIQPNKRFDMERPEVKPKYNNTSEPAKPSIKTSPLEKWFQYRTSEAKKQ